MDFKEKLLKLKELSKCGVSIDINEHKNNNETIEEYVESISLYKYVEFELIDKIKQHDTIVSIQFYPENSIGWYIVYHYNLETAIDEALKILQE